MVRERLGGASSSFGVGGERWLRGDSDSEVGESMSDHKSVGTSMRAVFALGVGSSRVGRRYSGNAFSTLWSGPSGLYAVLAWLSGSAATASGIPFLSNGMVHELPHCRLLALVHLPLCAMTMS